VRMQRFELGQLVATPGALEVLGKLEVSPSELLERHASGDWGAVSVEDARENELSVSEGFRIVSSYPLGEEARKVWVITEADRSSSCILLPEEY
jgi:hypothetical protein